MRLIIHAIAFITFFNCGAFCSEAYARVQSFSVVSAYQSESFEVSLNQIKWDGGRYTVAENSLMHNKNNRSTKKPTSAEGSVELIEMIKIAKSKKNAVKSKN